MTTIGLLLAAGAGSRMGRPKALVHDADGTSWLRRSVAALHEGGCARVAVVLGAQADEARPLLDGLDVDVVVASGWELGLATSLSDGLSSLDRSADGVLVSLVDLPDVDARVVRRVLAQAVPATGLARASFGGRPGHPVYAGRDHWAGMVASATGDEGARGYLAQHQPLLVECGDLADGHDVDRRG